MKTMIGLLLGGAALIAHRMLPGAVDASLEHGVLLPGAVFALWLLGRFGVSMALGAVLAAVAVS
jgi:hypothetical protein